MPLVTRSFSDIITFTRASTGTYFDANGALQLAAGNQPRFDHDPVTGAPLGILIEEQRTNLLLRSSEFDNAAWIKLAVVVTANTIVAPDGTLTAESLIEDSASNFHQTAQVTNPVAGTYTLSAYAKQAGRRFVTMTPVNQGAAYTDSTNRAATFDLQAGTITQLFGSGTAATITSAGDGWYRLTCTVTTNNASTSGPSIRLSNSPTPGAGMTYLGDGTSGIYIWGAQLESGSFPTSYIPTVASQVTRAADVCSVNTLSPWYNQEQGTLFAEVSSKNSIGYLFELSAGSANRILLRADGASGYKGFLISGGTSVSISNGAPWISGQVRKSALAMGGTGFAVASGGAAPASATSVIPVGEGSLKLGHALGNVSHLNGHIESIRYFPRALSSAELQRLTA